MFKNKLGKSFSNPFYEIFQDSLHEINLIEQTISQIEKNLTASEQDFIEKYNEKNVKLNDPHLADNPHYV
jgi:DNA-binding XRE family transcriptional regulator